MLSPKFGYKHHHPFLKKINTFDISRLINPLLSSLLCMKKLFLFIIALFFISKGMAQQQLAFPFQGGKEVMVRFFNQNVVITPEILEKKATGLVLFKFTADERGHITKIIIYYADDALLAVPIVPALKKSTKKWIIPDHERFHDFILPFSFNISGLKLGDSTATVKAVYDGFLKRKPILSNNQIPLDLATLLPPININYELKP